MSRRDIGTDDPRVKVRAGKSSRPRTKVRPSYENALLARVIGVDRGRFRLVLEDGVQITAVKARDLGRRGVVMGDMVRVVGDLSGAAGSLARIVSVMERTSILRRSTEDGEARGNEKVIVANADLLVVVTALADPPPRMGMIDRCLVAAYNGGLEPILCLTKSDLADPTAFIDSYTPLGVRVLVTTITSGGITGIDTVKAALTGHVSVLVGHSGVGKSTLINELIPQANRETGAVNTVTGRGRHTSTSAVAFALPDSGWVVDTPGIRSFGLAHVQPEDLLRGFPDLDEICQQCPRGCNHLGQDPNCGLDQWATTGKAARMRVASLRRLIASRYAFDQGN